MPNDPKWRSISRASGQPITAVISVYVHMLVCASNATERGRTQGWNDEDVAAALDLDTCDVSSIREAMQGRVLDGELLRGWNKRQPKREDNGADRAREWREEKKAERNRTQPNAENAPEKRREEVEENIGAAAPPEVTARTAVETVKAASAKASANTRGSRLTIEALPDEWGEWASEDRGWTNQRCIEVFEMFHDFWFSKAGKDAVKLNWFMTWKNWCKSQRIPPGEARNGTSQPKGEAYQPYVDPYKHLIEAQNGKK